MDYSKIKFKTYIPSYDQYLKILEDDKSINEYVYFSKFDACFIFLDEQFVGFYKIIERDEDTKDQEIYIAISKEFRGKGIATYVLNVLCNNIFSNNSECEFVHLSIDCQNEASIKMAKKAGFHRNEKLEEELRMYDDNRTLIFSREKQKEYLEDNGITR